VSKFVTGELPYGDHLRIVSIRDVYARDGGQNTERPTTTVLIQSLTLLRYGVLCYRN